MQTPQTFNMQEANDACIDVEQERMAILHRDVVAILWHSSRKPAVSVGPPPTELEGKLALEDSLVKGIGWLKQFNMGN